MSAHNHSEAVYVEYLTVTSWLRIIVPALRRLAQENPHHKPCCYIFDCTPAALWLARSWAFCARFYVEQLDFQIIDVRDEQGVAVFLRALYYRDPFEIQDLILNNHDFKTFIQSLDPACRAGLYLAKAPVCTYNFYDPQKYEELCHVLIMTHIVRWHARRSNNTGETFYLYINQRPWMKELQAYARSYSVHLQCLGALRLRRWQWAKYKNKLRKLTFSLLKSIVSRKVFDLKVRYKLAQNRSYFTTDTVRMLAEYYGQLNLDDPQCQSDVFFSNEKWINLKDILFVFNLALDPIDEEKYKILRSHGLAAVALTPQSSIVDPALVQVFHPQTRASAGSPDDLSSTGKSDEIKALTSSLNEYQALRSYWRQFFQQYNVKLYTSWNKCETNHIAISDAIADVGGVSTIYQRSYEPNAMPQVTVGADIIFGFSPHGYGIECNNGSLFRYHITVGYIGDYRFELLRPQASGIRQRLMAHGAKHIIAYFDENSVDDGRWFIGHQVAQENYRFWLEKFLADPGLGLIFKPKKPNTLRQRLGPVNKLLVEAEKTGRCFVFEGGVLQGRFPPAAAALAADIAVHDTLSSGTAGLESALAGVPTLLLDPEGWPFSPLYQLGDNVVFKDWDSIWKACRNYFENPSAYPQLGDWSAHKKELDPFNDGKASLRMSQFLKWMLDDLRAGKARETAMDDAAERYAKLWGKEKVQRGPYSK